MGFYVNKTTASMSSVFSRSSEAYASELRENTEDIFLDWMFLTMSITFKCIVVCEVKKLNTHDENAPLFT